MFGVPDLHENRESLVKMCGNRGMITGLLLQLTDKHITTRSKQDAIVLKQQASSSAGVSNLWPAGQMWPTGWS